MIITKIEEFKKDRFKIFIDDEFAFVLYKGELKSFKISVNQPIYNNTYEEICNVILPKRAKVRTLNLLKSHMYTEFEIRTKLSESCYSDEVIDIAIDYAKSYHYINDEEYVFQYLMSRIDSKSRFELKAALLRKGIDSDIFDKIYNEFIEESPELESELIKKLLDKRLKHISINEIDKSALNKHIAYLMNKGFSYGSINRCIEFMREND